MLFTQEFYWIAREKLNIDGLIAVQAGSASPTELLNFTAVSKTLKSVFPIVAPYATYMQCFGGPWGFCTASRKHSPALLTSYEIDARIKARSLQGLSFYDGETHRGMFALPLYIRKAIAAQKRIITDKKPLYLYKD
jgi:spermidine synthase